MTLDPAQPTANHERIRAEHAWMIAEHERRVAEEARVLADRARARADEERTRLNYKRQAIVDAATTLFLRTGYLGTSMDEIARLAEVSKQTVYKSFGDKQRLFTEIVTAVTDRSDEILDRMTAILDDCVRLEPTLTDVAVYFAGAVLQPELVRIRRLVIAEAGRFPELAWAYYERAPARTIATLATAFGRLAARGLLSTDDPATAAGHFAYLVLSVPLDRALFAPADADRPADLDRIARAGVRVFVAAYAAGSSGQ
ncbi:MAG TPA: TetR/AcrR family transcriptional regulator [Solirubrobacteraceae bacterium]|nr:TetR/AcrR family transcriptional regulator [Solirubrobacteraceae bacterium]